MDCPTCKCLTRILADVLTQHFGPSLPMSWHFMDIHSSLGCSLKQALVKGDRGLLKLILSNASFEDLRTIWFQAECCTPEMEQQLLDSDLTACRQKCQRPGCNCHDQIYTSLAHRDMLNYIDKFFGGSYGQKSIIASRDKFQPNSLLYALLDAYLRGGWREMANFTDDKLKYYSDPDIWQAKTQIRNLTHRHFTA